MSRNVRILHISDLHMRSVRGPQGERAAREAPMRNRVITSTWPANIRDLLSDGKPVDVIAVTGDLGDWGDPTDYPDAIKFLRELCELVELDPQRLFIIPGNHDIARTQHAATWKALRDALPTASPRAVSEWMAGGKAPPGFDDAWRDTVLERERPFWDAITGTLLRADLAPWNSPHRRLGYRATFAPGPRGVADLGRPTFPIHIIGLDSAWLAGDDHDPGKLRLTDHQVELLATREGAALPGLRIALVHHRFADLADGAHARTLLADRVDLVLHGHQHEATTETLADPDRTLLVLAAGCLYEGDEQHRYKNAYQLIDIDADAAGRPQHVSIRFRGWSTSALCWGDDSLLYRHAPAGRLRLRRTRHGWAAGDPPPEPHRPRPTQPIFVGRTDELAALDAALQADAAGRIAIVTLQGMGGVGKTCLAQEYLRHRPTPVERLILDPAAPGTADTWLQDLAARRELPEGPDALPLVRDDLRATHTLVHIDNVDSEAAATTVADLASSLDGVPMIVTGRYLALGSSATSGWTRIELSPLTLDESIALLRAEIGPSTFSDTVLTDLAKMLGCLPLALHLAAGYLRAGYAPDHFLARLDARGKRLGPRDPADHLRRDRARNILGATLDISRDLFLEHARADRDRWSAAYAALAWAPLAGFNRSLAAAICNFDEDDFSIDDFLQAAVDLSLVRRDTPTRWSLHPMLATLGQHDQRDRFGQTTAARAAVDERISIWISMLANPSQDHDRGARWAALSEAHVEVAEWLRSASPSYVTEVVSNAWRYAESHGPLMPWLEAARTHDAATTSLDLLSAWTWLAMLAGFFDEAMQVARQLASRANDERDEPHAAFAAGKIADILVARGDLDEALRLRRDEELPVYERLGDVRSRAITMRQIAVILRARGELDESLRLLRDEALPVLERLGDVLAVAITMDQIVDVYCDRRDFDKAATTLRSLIVHLEAPQHRHRRRATLIQLAHVLRERGGDGDDAEASALLRQALNMSDACALPPSR